MKLVKRHDRNKNIFPVFALILIALLAVKLIRFYLKSGGISGLSPVLPLLLAGVILFAFAMSAFFAAWVYEDCRRRGGDAVLWALLTFFLSPFIGLLVYFLRRPEIRQECPRCGHRISLRAKYCEECGTHIIPVKEEIIMQKKTHHLGFILGGTICLILTLVSLTGFIVTAVTVDGAVNDSPGSPERVWNTGVIFMSFQTSGKDSWDLNFSSATDGYIEEHRFDLDDPDSKTLTADISCGTVPDGASLTLWLVQGDKAESVDVTNLSKPLAYPLDQFDSGKLIVRLQINGVEDTECKITIDEKAE